MRKAEYARTSPLAIMTALATPQIQVQSPDEDQNITDNAVRRDSKQGFSLPSDCETD